MFDVAFEDGGLRHVYRAVKPPPVDRFWGVELGEVAHALRSSLDHLAWQLCVANGKTPGGRTKFPILKDPPMSRGDDGSKVRIPLSIGKLIPAGALEIIESVQPYNRGGESFLLSQINELDILDKHIELIVTVATIWQATYFGPAEDPLPKLSFSTGPLEDGKVAATVTYATPKFEPDPALEFFPKITFADGMPHAREPVSGVLWGLYSFVQYDFLHRFFEWVPPSV